MHAMWHNTGNTLPMMVNGRQTGSKKVLVLHTNKNFDQQRTNWVMHQYHLGDLEQEKERELVLCKIFYQTNTRARSKKIISYSSLVLVLVLPCRPQVGIVVNDLLV